MDEEHTFALTAHVYRAFSIAFLLVGTVANILSAIVYSKRRMRKTSYSVYLLTLALVDLFVILTGCTRLLFMSFDTGLSISSTSASSNQIFKGIDIRETSLYACRLHRFLTYFLLQFSSVILCMLSIDRFFGCVLVLKSSRFCKPSIARKLVVGIMFTLAALNSHFLVSMGYTVDTQDPRTNRTLTRVFCEPNELDTAYRLFWSAYFYIDTAIYCIVPFFVMLTCNLVIISKIISSRIRSKQVVMNHNRKKAFIVQKSHQQQQQPTTAVNTPSNSANNNNSSRNYMLVSERRISIILVGISISFVLFTLPVFVMENVSDAYYVHPTMHLLLALAYMLMYLNHVINFFFYCSLGPTFRKEVRKLVPKFWLMRTGKVNPMTFKNSRCGTTAGFASSARLIHSSR